MKNGKTIKHVTCCRCVTMLLLMMSYLSAGGQSAFVQVQDSLSDIYVSVLNSKQMFIVDQGMWKALFNKYGRPITPFIYKNIRPGIDNHFIASTDHQSTLLNTDGEQIGIFPGVVTTVDTQHRVYKLQRGTSIEVYDAIAKLLKQYTNDEYGPLQLYHSNYGSQRGVVDTFGNRVLPEIFNGDISINGENIVAIKYDTAYVYHREKLKFRCPANACKMFRHGVVAIQLYGLWGFRDSTGKPLTPYKYFEPKELMPGNFIETDGFVIDYKGKELMKGEFNSVSQEPGGWYTVHYPRKYSDDIVDEHFKLVFRAEDYDNAEFIGSRFIRLYKKSNQGHPRVYDRLTKKFVDFKMQYSVREDEEPFIANVNGRRLAVCGNKSYSLPPFKTITKVEGASFFIVSDDASPISNNDREDLLTDVTRFLVGPYHSIRYGLLDSNMRWILPLKYASINVLGNKVIYAADTAGRRTAIFNEKGKQIVSMEAATATLTDATIVFASDTKTMLLDTFGQIFYSCHCSPKLLFYEPSHYNNPGLPRLLLSEDSSGNLGVYNRAGKQLLPYRYYIVTERMPGLVSLKKDDSVYFMNANGRLLYNGRGFEGRNYFLLESYAVLVKNNAGRWGVLDANGQEITPFLYDTAGILTDGNSQKFIGKDGKFTMLDMEGRPRYPLQPWLPMRFGDQDTILATDSQYYAVSKEKVTQLGKRMSQTTWQRARTITNGFVEVRENDYLKTPPGIYNRQQQLVAPYYSGFQYPSARGLMMITDSATRRTTLIDTTGKQVLSWLVRPDKLINHGRAIVAIYRAGNDLLFRREKDNYIKEEIVIDSAEKATLLSEGSSPLLSYTAPIRFRSSAGFFGLSIPDAPLLWDPSVEDVIAKGYPVRIKRQGSWGLFDNQLNEIMPCIADSVYYKDNQLFIAANGRKGLYVANYPPGFIPPLFKEIYNPGNLPQMSFLVVKNDSGFLLINEYGKAITPVFDSISVRGEWLRSLPAFKDGQEMYLSIKEDGTIGVSSGGTMKVRKRGFDGADDDLVILRNGDKFGLYSNETFRNILPVQYDVITKDRNENFFTVWKYKANKHEGIDSTIVVDQQARLVMMKFKGGYHPVYQEGLWYLMGEKTSPVLRREGTVIVPAGYDVEPISSGSFFIVSKDGKNGIIDANGKWILDMTTDKLDGEGVEAQGMFIGEVTDTSNRAAFGKQYLINPKGKRLTKPIYDSIDVNEEKIEFTRGDIEGYLDELGREVVIKNEE